MKRMKRLFGVRLWFREWAAVDGRGRRPRADGSDSSAAVDGPNEPERRLESVFGKSPVNTR